MRLLYTATIFLSAALLFMVQPLFAKMVLPRFGGTPGVWSTCMVFFQATLLAGYAYASVTSRLAPRKQALLHTFVLLLPWLALPITAPAEGSTDGGNPVPALLAALALRVALPFFVVSTTSPLLQSWFGRTDDPHAHDPYFLYSASNVGSLLGLLGYPFVVERTLTLSTQSRVWTAGYVLLTLLAATCAWTAKRADEAKDKDGAPAAPAPPLTTARQLRWLALAAVPSAQLLAVTTFLTTDLFSAPLLWVVPLALYLLSFVNVFARRPLVPHAFVVKTAPVVLAALVAVIALDYRNHAYLWWILAGHLAAFFWVALLCHGELAADRPERAHLTRFYLVMSLAGVLGGSFVALLAPVVFTHVIEYPITVAAALLLLPQRAAGSRRLDVALAIGAGALVFASRQLLWVPLAVALFSVLHGGRGVRFGLIAVAVTFASVLGQVRDDKAIYLERSFFGVSRVTRLGKQGTTNWLHTLWHGTTTHGRQKIDPATSLPTDSRWPVGYYFPGGPFSRYFASVVGKAPGKRVGVIGLGAGSIAGHVEPGQSVVFYEIDAAVDRIAQDPRLFTYLSDARARGAQVDVVLGDARLTLAADKRTFDLLCVDAFSSDTIPVHLITREALERVYLPHVADGGAIAFNVSNRYFDLRPIVGDLAASLGLVCLACEETVSLTAKLRGCDGSHWAVVARDERPLQALLAEGRWTRVLPRPRPVVWTDDSSDILSAFAR